ncbi:Na(+)-translocating NADH-quinone reductase subunit B [Candidatus Similichlamydia laticola]|uniref:Na(+)-translocating NADH-quinone reductase subunit B n=2 Tax=Candidatus Similichlamydia laticola TaxID=2170265 RepID=A0A369KF90_9BACT|nr:Na(+)-translocating NADH-quinone reductase subunit B [Candidatus Similichlamydia laticola]
MIHQQTGSTRKNPPYIYNAITLDNWIGILIIALIPCFCTGAWSVGIHSLVFSSEDLSLLTEFYKATKTPSDYVQFCFRALNPLHVIASGLLCLIPITFTACFFSFLTEWTGSKMRGKEPSRWWIVTGLIFALAMPPTIPLWMVAFGITMGTLFGKEVFGGHGMNVFNPALIARCFLVLSFPGNFCGDVWIAPDMHSVQQSVEAMTQQRGTRRAADMISASSPLGQLAITKEVRQIHLDALALHLSPHSIAPSKELEKIFEKWTRRNQSRKHLGALNSKQLEAFLTSSRERYGLGLKKELFIPAVHMAKLYLGEPPYTIFGLLMGVRPGCCGEVGLIGPLSSALILLWYRVASGFIMLSVFLGSLITLVGLKWLASFQQNPFELYAKYAIPAHVHLMMGGLAFGTVFMATDPVSAPADKYARILYGFLIGSLVMLVRLKSSAFKEGVMFSILIGNVVAPLLDQLALELHFMARRFRRGRSA